ncbi:uncharacterized protein LOC144116270 isoform X1 [Amblyomma americanum]
MWGETTCRGPMRVRSLPATASRPPSCIFCVAPLRCLSSGSCQLSRWFATADVEASRRWLGRCRLFNLKLTATIRTVSSQDSAEEGCYHMQPFFVQWTALSHS